MADATLIFSGGGCSIQADGGDHRDCLRAVNWPGVMPSELAALCPSLHVVRLLERTG